ncbi:hypothetical protein F5Y01DRAFT_321535 [Xylaria sp. FL0043]|nr:hypothetical protein F5Y01DRAFT_321535 [Xylaria sp. FL0043]
MPARKDFPVHKQAPSRESKTAVQRQRRHTRSGQEELLEAHSEPEKNLRKPRGKGAGAPKISDSNNALALEAVETLVPSIESLPVNMASSQVSDSEDSSYPVEKDPLESWYTNVGYLPVLGESTFDILEQVLSPSIMSSIKRKLFKSKADRTLGLDDRNVRMYSCSPTDPFLAVFHKMEPLREANSSIQVLGLHDEVKKHYGDEWKRDLEKAIEDEVEATFQRTVMMSMLDRYRLIYSLKDGNQSILDFAVESTWNCPFMPTRALNKNKPDRQRMLSRPKPDISIAFRRSSIIEDGIVSNIPLATRRIMAYEAQDGTRTQRVFHFLMVEAKNADKTSSDKESLIQILNSASQSLHCLYEFFNEADRQEVNCDQPCCTPGAVPITTSNRKCVPAGEDTFVGLFFKEVRVFTVVSTGTAVTIRMHRACPASTLPFPSHEGRPPFQTQILPDYPLQFEYNELITLSDDGFAREKLVDTFEKIMVDYGIGRLRPLLQKASAAIVDKFYRWELEKRSQYVLGMRHYSHGQTAPPPSAQMSRAASQASRLSSVSAASQTRSSASPDVQEAHFSFSTHAVGSHPEPPKKKTRTE